MFGLSEVSFAVSEMVCGMEWWEAELVREDVEMELGSEVESCAALDVRLSVASVSCS